MNILALNGGKFSSIEGAVVRYKNLVVKPTRHHTTWVDPVTSRGIYKTEDLDDRVPKNVTVVPGKKCASNPLAEWWARERHFLEAAKAFRGDVCIVYNAWGTRLAQRHLNQRKIPVVFDFIDLMHSFRANPVERQASKAATNDALRKSQAVTVTADKLRQYAGAYNEKTVLVPNGVDVPFYANASKKKLRHPCVGFVGGFGQWLDFGLLDLAIRDCPDVHFYFVGDGPAKAQLPEAANVHVSDGFIPQNQARRWVKGFDVCVIPFRKNALTDAVCPLKLFEYWAAGKAVLARPTHELERIVKDEAVLAVGVKKWRNQIRRLADDAAARRALGKKGFKAAARYSWKNLSRRFVSVLEDVSS